MPKSEEKIDFEFDKDGINLVTVARLVEQKAIDRLVKVHSKLIKDGYNPVIDYLSVVDKYYLGGILWIHL